MRAGLALKFGLQLQHAPRAWNATHVRNAQNDQDVRDQCSPEGLRLAVAAFDTALAVGFDRGVHLLAAACVTKY